MDDEEVKVEEEVKKVIISEMSGTAKTEGAANRSSTGQKEKIKTPPPRLSSDEKTLPHYLRASTSSCHESCKHGTKHVFEVKKRKPAQRRSLASREIPGEVQKPEVLTVRGRGKRLQPKAKNDAVERVSFEHSLPEESISIKTMTAPAPDQVEELYETHETTKLDDSSPTEKRVISHEPVGHLSLSETSSEGPEIMDMEMPAPFHTPPIEAERSAEESLEAEIIIPSLGIENKGHADEPITQKKLKAKLVPPTGRSIASAKPRSASSKDKSSEKTLSMKLKAPSLNKKSVVTTGEGNVTKKSSKQLKTKVFDSANSTKEKKTAQPTVTKKKIVSPMEKTQTLTVKPKTMEQKSTPSVKEVVTPGPPRVIKQKALSTVKRSSAPPSATLKPKPSAPRSLPALIVSRRLSLPGKIKDNTTRSTDSGPISSRRLSLPIKLPVGREVESLKAMKVPFPSKVQGKPGKLENAKTRKTEGNEDIEKTKKVKPIVPSKPEEKRRLIRTSTARVPSEAKIASPLKLNFRRGKIVNPMPADSAPKKLGFRQPKGINENQSSKEVVRRIRRRRGSLGSARELIIPSLRAPAVVLRHQDVQEKEAQGLLNHVIEETASKLVEERKSKVKALVGAFETVISLQEGRAVPPTT